MIVISLNGGLGNQLFQYACGRSLSLRLSTQLKLDMSAYTGDNFRKLCLNVFNFKIVKATESDLSWFSPTGGNHLLKIRNKLFNPILKPVIINEKSFSYDSRILSITGKYALLKGYWQSEKYFNTIRGTLLEDLKITAIINTNNSKWEKMIKETNSVSVHIRRGDYISNPATTHFHGACSLDYYRNGINYIVAAHGPITVFVFSDDIKWARANFKVNYETRFVDANDDSTNYEDMRLMSLCKHNVIANSSFSWWGAWLNRNPNKIVVAPKRWFADEKANQETNTLIPETWIRI